MLVRFTKNSFLTIFLVGLLSLLLRANAFAQVTFEDVPGHSGPIRGHMLSGDGEYAYFISSADNGNNPDMNWEVFGYKVSSKQLFQITNTTAQPGYMSNKSLAVSGDGRRLIVRSNFALDTDNSNLTYRDLFLIELDTSVPPNKSITRLTYSAPDGPYVLSRDGKVVILGTDTALVPSTQSGVQLYRIQLDPSPSITRLTNIEGGIAHYRFRLEIATNYNGDIVDIATQLPSDDGALQDKQVYRVIVNNLLNITFPTEGIWQSNIVMNDSGDTTFFISNGDHTGDNSDGSKEIFRSRGTAIRQLTNITGNTTGFGMPVDDLQTVPDGQTIFFSSNNDLAPADSNSPGNADLNIELFKAEILTTTLSIQQLTDTQNPQPNTRIENRYPKVSSDGSRMLFNSDLDLGLTNQSMLNLAYIAEPPDISPPNISNFNPYQAGPGTSILVSGSHFNEVQSFKFGAQDAHTFTVDSPNQIHAVVPFNVVDDVPLEVTTAHGMAESSSHFRLATLTAHDSYFTHGLASYDGIVGKDALVRMLLTVEGPLQTLPATWTIGSAELAVTRPDGSTFTVQPQMFSDMLSNLSNRGVSHSERDNVNFYVDGDLFNISGDYTFNINVRTLGQLTHSSTINKTLTTAADLTLVFSSLFRPFDQDEWRTILDAFEVVSRAYPIRNGIGDIQGVIGADPPNEGLRVAWFANPIWEGVEQPPCTLDPNMGCWSPLLDEAEDRRDAINLADGFEHVNVSTVFMPRDRLLTFSNGYVSCPITNLGAGGYGRNNLFERTNWVQLCTVTGSTLAHESGHNFGLVPSSFPTNNGGTHSIGSIDEPAFNLKIRELQRFPSPMMGAIASAPDERIFFESRSGETELDFPFLLRQVRDLPLQFASAGAPSSNAALSIVQSSTPISVAISAKESTSHPTRGKQIGPRSSLTKYKRSLHQRLFYSASLSTDGKIVRKRSFVLPPGKVIPEQINKDAGVTVTYLNKTGKALRAYNVNLIKRKASPEFKITENSAIRFAHEIPRDTQKVVISVGDNTLDELIRNDSQAFVSDLKIRIQKPKKNLDISWNASKRSEGINYMLEISTDGGKSYVPFAFAEKSPFRTSIDALPGKGKAMIRLIASSGLSATRLVSDVFVIPNRKPVPMITSPEKGKNIFTDDWLTLRGSAFDLDEGMIVFNGNNKGPFAWFIDKVKIGSGSLLTWRGNLTPGKHEVMLKVRDDIGSTGIAKTWVYVKRPVESVQQVELEKPFTIYYLFVGLLVVIAAILLAQKFIFRRA